MPWCHCQFQLLICIQLEKFRGKGSLRRVVLEMCLPKANTENKFVFGIYNFIKSEITYLPL